jgi:hypothetical protein
MERTGRSFLAVGALVALLALSAATGDAAPVAAGGTIEPPSTLAGSPTAFAERLAASHKPTTSARAGDSLQEALELIVLAAVCALVVALYSSASAERDRSSPAARRRRR